MTISEIPKMLYGMPFISWVEYLVGTVLLVRLLLDLTKHV